MNSFLANRVLQARIFLVFGIGIVFVLLFFIIKSILFPSLAITNVTPDNGTISQSVFPIISATFSKPITASQRQQIAFTLKPEKQGKISFSSDKKTVTFETEGPLDSATNYSVSITLGSLSKTWSFKTTQNVSQSEGEKIQGQLDYQAGVDMTNFINSHPWYDKLPIITESYFIAYDAQKKEFTAFLYPKKSSDSPIDTQVTEFKKEVLQELKNIGIDTSTYNISWTITLK